MKKWIISILAVLIVGGIAGVLIVKNQPENVALAAVSGVFEDVLERTEIEPLAKMLKSGSLSVDMTKCIDSDGEDLFEDIGISKLGGKIYFSQKNDSIYMQDCGVDVEDEAFRFDFFASNDLWYVKSDFLDGAYGVKYDEALGQFEESIFHNSSKSEYSLSKEESKELSELLEDLPGSKERERMKKDLSELAEYYVKEFWKIFCDNVEIESETRSVKVGKEKVSARVVYFSFDDRDLSNILDEFADFVAGDDKLEEFIDNYETSIDSFLEALEPLIGKMDASDIVDELADAIEAFAKSVKGSFEEVSVEIATPKLSSKLLKFSTVIESKDGTSKIVIDFGKNGAAKSERIEVSLKSLYSDEEIELESEYSFLYTVSKNDNKSFASSLKASYESTYNNGLQEFTDDEEIEVISIAINKNKGKFDIKLLDERYAINGKWSQSGDSTTFDVQEILAIYDEESEEYNFCIEVGLKITIDESDTMPTIGKYKELSDITEKDVDGWIETFEDMFGKMSDEDAPNLVRGVIPSGVYADEWGSEIEVSGNYMLICDDYSDIELEYYYIIREDDGEINIWLCDYYAGPHADSDVIEYYESELYEDYYYTFSRVANGFVIEGTTYYKQ